MTELTVDERVQERMGRRMPGPLVEPSARWMRVRLGDVTVADSRRTLLSRQFGRGILPTYYFPQEDVRMDLLEPAGPFAAADDATSCDVRADGQVAKNGALVRGEPAPELADLAGYVTFTWDKGLRWFEEEEEVHAHARDPYHRIDVLRSSRHVKVVVDGVTLADTSRPTLLFETLLPTRYYVPQEDVRMDLLEPTQTKSRCAYKGQASYWSVKVGDRVERDLAWGYMEPTLEASKIKGLPCFFNERVDLYVDGELQERPVTPWSRK